MAKGNIPAAVFNVTLSSLMGMLLTPAFIALLQSSGTHPLPLEDTIIDIALKLFVPFVLGQIFRRWIGNFIAQHKEAPHCSLLSS